MSLLTSSDSLPPDSFRLTQRLFGRLGEMEVDNLYKNIDIQIMVEVPIKTVVWIGPTLKELKAFPRPVQRAVGLAFYAAQLGETPLPR